MTLPISPPFAPMEALPARDIPGGSEWQYEPKWDGFRCLIFNEGKTIELQSKKGESLNRYFPELVASVQELAADKFVALEFSAGVRTRPRRRAQ
jgi:ATP-dependent DNA ligase